MQDKTTTYCLVFQHHLSCFQKFSFCDSWNLFVFFWRPFLLLGWKLLSEFWLCGCGRGYKLLSRGHGVWMCPIQVICEVPSSLSLLVCLLTKVKPQSSSLVITHWLNHHSRQINHVHVIPPAVTPFANSYEQHTSAHAARPSPYTKHKIIPSCYEPTR